MLQCYSVVQCYSYSRGWLDLHSDNPARSVRHLLVLNRDLYVVQKVVVLLAGYVRLG